MTIRTRSRFGAVVYGLLLAFALVAMFVGVVPEPAHAADRPKPLISSDGKHFGNKLDAGLFDGFGQMVPGDVVTGTFWVKNPLSADAVMRVSVRNFVSPSAAFSSAVTFSAWDSVSDVTEVSPLTDFFDCKVVVPTRQLDPGEIVKVDLTLTMDDVVQGRIAQNDRGEISFVVAMRDGAAGDFPASACDDEALLLDPDDAAAEAARLAELRRLAMTGSELPTSLILAAGILIGTGFFFVSRRRRRRVEQ